MDLSALADMSAVNMLIGFIIIMSIAFLIFFRVKVGKVSPRDHSGGAYRRNNLVIAAIFLYFLFYLFTVFMKGGLAEKGIVGWKAYAFVATFVLGIVSVALILYGTFRRR
ncbi:hypothetical protein ACFL6I_00385 [candidate division KSB1 bacterium]